MTTPNFMRKSWQKFKAFYQASAENRIGFYTFLAFIVIPAIGLTLLYIFVNLFWLK